jgi:nicotinamide-nucleotide amidase
MIRAVLIAIGEELLTGTVVNTNAATLSEELLTLGIPVRAHFTVGDVRGEIQEAVTRALQEFDLVLVTGGLGPTEDDRTTEAVAAALGIPLELHPESLKRIRAIFEYLGRTMMPNNEKQAYLPQGAEILANNRGTAPGFMVAVGRRVVCCLPGVPSELQAMFQQELKPRLLQRYPAKELLELVTYRTFGLPESQVDTLLRGIDQEFPFVYWGLRARYLETDVRFLIRASDSRELEGRKAQVEKRVRELLGEFIFGEGKEELEKVVGESLRNRGLKLAVAESCTGGLVADRITNVSGSSDYFDRGVVVYSNEAKTDLLGVPADLIQQHGAVSGPVAEAMARGILARSQADLGLAITGIAGPSGGSEEKPVGTVHVALADKTKVEEKRYLFRGTRDQIKRIGSDVALDRVRRYLLK